MSINKPYHNRTKAQGRGDATPRLCAFAFPLLSLLLAAIAVLPLCSCGGKGRTTSSSETAGDTLRYASLLTISHGEGYTRVDIADPWNSGRTLHTYLLVPADAALPKDLPHGTVVRTPLRRAVIATSVHCGLLAELGRSGSIRGVCDPRYINLPQIAAGLKSGSITDCGSGLAPTVEKIIDINADAVLLSPFQNSGGYGKLERTGIPIIEAADYMETSALGRAEWMRFYGMLFGAGPQADSVFASVESRYRELAAMARRSSSRRSVVMDSQSGSVWYVPGGRSTIGGLLRDACADYPFASDDHSGSVPLPFESVLERAAGCDVWLLRYNAASDMTLSAMKADKDGYTRFRAWQTGEVYGCNTANNTFYEDTPFRPDLLLRDFIIICHPELADTLGLPGYFVKLKR